MDHASGWYKRNTQRILVVIAVVLCMFNNVDTVSLVGHLSTDPQMRAAAATEALGFLNATGPSLQAVGPRIERAAKFGGGPEQRTLQYKLAIDATTLPLWWTKSEWNKLLYTVEYIETHTLLGRNQATGRSPASEKAKACLSIRAQLLVAACEVHGPSDFDPGGLDWRLRSGSTFSTSWLTSAWSGTRPDQSGALAPR